MLNMLILFIGLAHGQDTCLNKVGKCVSLGVESVGEREDERISPHLYQSHYAFSFSLSQSNYEVVYSTFSHTFERNMKIRKADRWNWFFYRLRDSSYEHSYERVPSLVLNVFESSGMQVDIFERSRSEKMAKRKALKMCWAQRELVLGRFKDCPK